MFLIPIVLSLSKNRPVYFSEQHFRDGVCLRLQVNPTQFGTINRDIDNVQKYNICINVYTPTQIHNTWLHPLPHRIQTRAV
jgi:hypothetical protein